MEASGELTADQMGNATRLNQVLSRVAFDLLVYVHARATEIKREDGADVVLTLHSSDETVVGRAMRGCGVVYCEAGRAIFARAISRLCAMRSLEMNDAFKTITLQHT
jgi:hypothetical protein|eukprot:6343905-Prymnesium_polylepis.1